MQYYALSALNLHSPHHVKSIKEGRQTYVFQVRKCHCSSDRPTSTTTMLSRRLLFPRLKISGATVFSVKTISDATATTELCCLCGSFLRIFMNEVTRGHEIENSTGHSNELARVTRWKPRLQRAKNVNKKQTKKQRTSNQQQNTKKKKGNPTSVSTL